MGKTEMVRVKKKTKNMLEELQEKMRHRNISETIEYLLGSKDVDQDQWLDKDDHLVPFKFIRFVKRWVPDGRLVKLEDFPKGKLPSLHKIGKFMDFVYAAVSVDEILKMKEDPSWDFDRLFTLHVKNCIRAVERLMKNYKTIKPIIYAVRTTMSDRDVLVFYNFMPKDAKIKESQP